MQTIKVIYQAFGRDSFNIIVNNARNEEEAKKIFNHIDSICNRFLGFSLHYLGHIVYDEAVPRSIMRQQVLANHHNKSTPSTVHPLQNVWLHGSKIIFLYYSNSEYHSDPSYICRKILFLFSRIAPSPVFPSLPSDKLTLYNRQSAVR